MKHPVLTLAALDRMASRGTRNYFSLAPTPHEEKCTQINEDLDASLLECSAYINQMIRVFGEPPEGTEFCIIENDHDLGVYYEAGIIWLEVEDEWDEEIEEFIDAPNPSLEYANQTERGLDHWDEIARLELEAGKHPFHYVKIIQLKSA